MIQVNKVTTTKGGLTLPTGILLNVNPHIIDYVDEFGLTKYNITFDVTIYKDMSAYLVNQVLINTEMIEFNVAYSEFNVDIQIIDTAITLGLLATHIENGDSIYPGVGVGNTAIVFPPII